MIKIGGKRAALDVRKKILLHSHASFNGKVSRHIHELGLKSIPVKFRFKYSHYGLKRILDNGVNILSPHYSVYNHIMMEREKSNCKASFLGK